MSWSTIDRRLLKSWLGITVSYVLSFAESFCVLLHISGAFLMFRILLLDHKRLT